MLLFHKVSWRALSIYCDRISTRIEMCRNLGRLAVIRTTARLDPDIAATVALIADPSRAAMLSALTDGLALPVGELARIAGVFAGDG
jgi:hypothetical protein